MAHEIIPIDGDLLDLIKDVYISEEHPAFIKIDHVFLAESYERLADAIEEFQVRDDDVWICSFPKTGTTWTQEMVWCIANDLDFEGAKKSILERSPYFEISSLANLDEAWSINPDSSGKELAQDSVELVEKLPSPRFIKTHLPFHLLPRQLRSDERKARIVYVVRNPKDTCISYFHHSSFVEGFSGSLEQFCTLFLGDSVVYAPFWKHVLGYWEKREEEKVLFLKYEEMKNDMPSVLKKTAEYFGKILSVDEISILADHLSFESMKANPAVNRKDVAEKYEEYTGFKKKGDFMRSGKIGQWKSDMSPELVKLFDDWTRENLENTDLHY